MAIELNVKEKKRDWNQQDLADCIKSKSHEGCSGAAVGQWERGDSKGLKPINLVYCSECLNVTEKWLTTGKEPKTPNQTEPALLPTDTTKKEIESAVKFLINPPPDRIDFAKHIIFMINSIKADEVYNDTANTDFLKHNEK